MSTSDVPGANPQNGDKLKMGCWAQHDDGSMLFVESTEGGRVIYSVFDLSLDPPVEFRDSMTEKGFKEIYTKAGWTWHDKTPFPWDDIIPLGAKSGFKYASAEDQITEAERIARARELRRQQFQTSKWAHYAEQIGNKGRVITDKIQRAIKELRT